MGGDLSVKGVEGGFEVGDKFVKGFLRGGNGGISHLVIPGFSIGSSSSSTHLVQGGHDFGGIRGVEGGVQNEICLHSFNPSGGIIILAQEVHRESSL